MVEYHHRAGVVGNGCKANKWWGRRGGERGKVRRLEGGYGDFVTFLSSWVSNEKLIFNFAKKNS